MSVKQNVRQSRIRPVDGALCTFTFSVKAVSLVFLLFANYFCQRFWLSPLLTHVNHFEKVSHFWTTIFRGKIVISRSIKGKGTISFPCFSHFSLSSSLWTQTFEFSTCTKTMGVKRNVRSSFLKNIEPSTLKINRPLLGWKENPSTEEQWIIPPFFEDYLFNNSFDWDSVLYSLNPPYTARGELDDLLTMDLDLKHIPWLGTCRGDFSPTIDVVFKSHTSISKGWRSWCQRVLTHPPFMGILKKVHLMHTVLVFSSLDINKDSESLLSLLYR